MAYSSEVDFTFTFFTKNLKSTLTAPIIIPLQHSVKEYVQRLITAHDLPCFVEDDLERELRAFVERETKSLEDEAAMEMLDQMKNGNIGVENTISKWSNAYSQEVIKYATSVPVSNEQVFSEVYHALIHSPALETLLNLEHTYSLSVAEVVQQRDHDFQHMEQRQRTDMDDAQESGNYTDEQINQLAQRHFENTQLIESKWASELSNLHETQKREYREWVMTVHEDTRATEATPAYVQRVRAMSSSALPGARTEDQESLPPPRREESFTVHLGAQLKTMHNLRLISANVLDFCKHKPHKIGGVMYPQPQRLQTAISLYSNVLCGLVLMVDNRLNSYSSIKRHFAKVCEQSTDFHFPDLEQQFVQIEDALEQAVDWRCQQRLMEDGDKISLKSSGSSSSEREDRQQRMRNGDFYLTRHSNLSEAHTVFHLVTDDSVRSATSDLSSRHPVILGYRNILKACFHYNIMTITLPLLLVHEMSEEMTIPWCLKRAELVLKCVKGFIMEFSQWRGQDSRTIQFLVPRALSDETFASINSMMPQIFRMSNPVVAKS